MKPTKPPSSNNSSAPSTPPPQAAPSFFISESLRLDILQKNVLTLAQPDVVRFPDLPNEVDNYHELCPLEPLHKPASTVLGYQTSTYKATNIKTGTRFCLRRVHGEFKFRWCSHRTPSPSLFPIIVSLALDEIGFDAYRFPTCQHKVYSTGRHVETANTHESSSAKRSLHHQSIRRSLSVFKKRNLSMCMSCIIS